MDGLDQSFAQYRPRIYRCLCHLVHDAELDEKLAQDTFLKACRAVPKKPGRRI